MIKTLLTLGAAMLFASPAFCGQFQDTLNDIDSQLREINQREFDRDWEQTLSTMSSEEILNMVRNIYRETSLPWARKFLIQNGTAADRASFEVPQLSAEQYQRWIEQQKANLRSSNAFVRKQARENLRVRGIY
jgi:hypothetical protein